MPHRTGKVLLQFGASWCGPCKTITPAAEDIALAEGITHVKVDIEENPDLANFYSIRGVPCFIVLKDGEELGRSQGAAPNMLRRVVQNCLKG